MTGRDERGQTLHDFAIGMTIFLLVLGYVFAFVPSLFAPFAPATDSSAVRADRTVDYLTQDVLAEREPGPGGAGQKNGGVLNTTCTVDFFDDDDDETVSGGNCPISESSLSIRDLLRLPERTEFNITMQRHGEIATHGGTRLAVGPEPNEAADRVLRSVRIVSLEGRDYHFVVRLW